MNELENKTQTFEEKKSKGASGAARILLVLALLFALLLPLALATRIAIAFNGSRIVSRLPKVEVSHAQAAAFVPRIPEMVGSGNVRVWTDGFQFGPQSFPQQGGPDDQFVFGGTYTLSEEETLNGNLIVMGGIATLEQASTVNGDVVLLGGTIQAHGMINGEVFIVGGLLNLSEEALVTGDVNAIGGHVEYKNRESVEGDINSGIEVSPPSVVVPGDVVVPQVNVGNNWFLDGIGWTIWYLFKAFLWTVVAVLVLLFLQRPAERVSQVIVTQPVISVGLGLMTAFVAPLLLVVVAITIIGIPISLIGFAGLAVAWGFGLVVVGLEVGKRLGRGFNQEWAMPVQAAVGTLVLVLVLNAVGKVVPCIGWIAPLLVGSLGLGAVLLTRFGAQDYPSPGAALPASATPVETSDAPELIKDIAGDEQDAAEEVGEPDVELKDEPESEPQIDPDEEPEKEDD